MENNYDNYDLNSEVKNPYSFQEKKINSSEASEQRQPEQNMTSSYVNQDTYLNNPYFDQTSYQNQNQDKRLNELEQMLAGESYTVYNTSNMPKDQGKQNGTTSLVMGIISIVLCCSGGFLSLILAILGLKLAKQAKEMNGGESDGTTTAGFICSLIGLILSSIILIGIIVMFILAAIYG